MGRRAIIFVSIIFIIISFRLSATPFIELPELKNIIGCEWLPSEDDYPEDDGVFLLISQNTEMKIGQNVYSIVTVHKVLRLFRNLEKYTTVNLNIGEGEKLMELDARTIKNDGTSVKLDKKDILKVKGTLDRYTEHVYSFRFPSAEKGNILEYRYVIRKDMPFVTDIWWIQHYLPVKKNRFTLTVPGILLSADWTWRYKAYAWENLPKPKQINPDFVAKGMVYTWELSEIPAFRPEPFMPAASLYRGHIKFSPSEWRTWPEVTGWYFKNYFKPQMIVDNKIEEIADIIARGCNSQHEIVSVLFKYVQKFRYESIPLGEAGLRPYPPTKVLENKYGDCKDKSILLIALLKAKGITAYPTLVMTADEGVIDINFPTWSFNHMMVKAITSDSTIYWLDPTASFIRPGEVPAGIQGQDALVITGDTTCSLEKIPASSDLNNSIDVYVNIRLKENEEANYQIKIAYYGCEAEAIRYLLKEKSDSQLREYCKSLIANTFLRAKVDNCSVINLENMDQDPLLQFEFTVADAVQRQGDLLILVHDPLGLLKNFDWLSREKRVYPLNFIYPFTVNLYYSINYPKGRYQIRNKPRTNIIEGPSMFYRNVFKEPAEGHISTAEVLHVKKQVLPPELFEKVLNFYAAVQKLKNDKIIFSKN